MKSTEEIMQILEAFDLTGSLRDAAELAGCDHHTVARYVALRDQEHPPQGQRVRPRLLDPYLEKLEEWVQRSQGKIRADVAHARLQGMGYQGSERTTRRLVRELKQAWQAGRRRVYRPWTPEPGMWFQWDWGSGPPVQGRETRLFCAWLAWSRYRVVWPTWDRTLPTLIACLDGTLRAFGGAPTYGLTDNEKTVTTDLVAGLPVRHRELAAAARHYGLTIRTCVPADPETKGGSEATVRLAKGDLLPNGANLLEEYTNFNDLAAACAEFCQQVNRRPHRETGAPPAERLQEERQRLHPIPEAPYTAAFGQTRKVSRASLVSVGGVRYSVPCTLVDQTVWVREAGDELIIVHVGPQGPVEVARHRRSTPGQPQVQAEHYPARSTAQALNQTPRATNPQEEAFLSIGPGARSWLVEAAAAGTPRLPTRMLEVLTLATMYGREPVDQALQVAATAQRFGPEDVAAILEYQPVPAGRAAQAVVPVDDPGDPHTLQPGTRVWEVLP